MRIGGSVCYARKPAIEFEAHRADIQQGQTWLRWNKVTDAFAEETMLGPMDGRSTGLSSHLLHQPLLDYAIKMVLACSHCGLKLITSVGCRNHRRSANAGMILCTKVLRNSTVSQSTLASPRSLRESRSFAACGTSLSGCRL